MGLPLLLGEGEGVRDGVEAQRSSRQALIRRLRRHLLQMGEGGAAKHWRYGIVAQSKLLVHPAAQAADGVGGGIASPPRRPAGAMLASRRGLLEQGVRVEAPTRTAKRSASSYSQAKRASPRKASIPNNRRTGRRFLRPALVGLFASAQRGDHRGRVGLRAGSVLGAGKRPVQGACDQASRGRHPHARNGSNARHIRNVLPEDAEAESLLVVEVITPGGHWSSYPPHKHDRDALPDESYLEETYYHRLKPAQGFAFQRIYTDDRSLDETLTVSDGDVVLVPKGYHSSPRAHGYELYYLNVMAGPKRVWRFHNDPAHEWLMAQAAA